MGHDDSVVDDVRHASISLQSRANTLHLWQSNVVPDVVLVVVCRHREEATEIGNSIFIRHRSSIAIAIACIATVMAFILPKAGYASVNVVRDGVLWSSCLAGWPSSASRFLVSWSSTCLDKAPIGTGPVVAKAVGPRREAACELFVARMRGSDFWGAAVRRHPGHLPDDDLSHQQTHARKRRPATAGLEHASGVSATIRASRESTRKPGS